jgi:hypothetical protein
VTATKFDCNAIGQDCRNVSRTAVSAPTPPVAAPTAPPVRLAIAGVSVERARRGLVVAVTVKDDRGRAVSAARVTVGRGSALTGTTGAARVAVRPGSRPSAVTLSVRAEKAGAEPAALQVRLPLAR